MNKLRHFFHATAVLVLGFAHASAESPAAPTPLVAALEARKLTMEASGNGRDALTLTLSNPSATPLTITIPAGLVASGHSPANRVVVTRTATVLLPAQNAVEVSLPIAALSSKNGVLAQPYRFQPDSEPRLAALLAALSDQPDAPRPTVQLAVLGLLEDLNFSQWRQFLDASAATTPTPAEVSQAIDALGLLQTVAPQQSFALGKDTELKLRALRNPWSRAKAVALYGLDSGGADALAPDLRQLLHTQPGDNCPICRQRALMQKQADIP